MNKLFIRNTSKVVTTCVVSFTCVLSADIAIAGPAKDCPPVVRSLKTKKLYCAHELKILRRQEARKNEGFLCLLLRTFIPSNDVTNIGQCFPKTNFSSKTGRKILPKPKGTGATFKILQPVGNIQLATQPTITWWPIPNASYRITIEQGGKWLWSHESQSTEIQLPASKPLAPGKTYRISVVAVRTRDKKPIAKDDSIIRLVDAKQLQQINTALMQAERLDRDPLHRGLDKAIMLYHLGLLDAAVTELRTLTQYQEPVVYSQLGLIFKEAGFKKMAQEYFDKASELAKRTSKPMS